MEKGEWELPLSWHVVRIYALFTRLDLSQKDMTNLQEGKHLKLREDHLHRNRGNQLKPRHNKPYLLKPKLGEPQAYSSVRVIPRVSLADEAQLCAAATTTVNQAQRPSNGERSDPR